MERPARTTAVLVIRSGDEPVQVVELTVNPFTIGRAEGNDLQLREPFASRRHARIDMVAGRHVVEDLKSKNGVFVNGEPLKGGSRPLEDGDLITFGMVATEVRFRSSNATITALDLKSPSPQGLHLDEDARRVWMDGEELDPPLPPKEFDLLCLLWRNLGKACGRDAIAQAVWPERSQEDVDTDEIGHLVRRLRSRIERDPAQPSYIQTVRGYGYRLSIREGGA